MWSVDYYRRPDVYLRYRYRDMLARVNGKVAGDGKSQLWLGLPIVDRPTFIEWATANEDFQRLYTEWVENKFVRRFAPSIHRIDRTKGYMLDNMTWVSHYDNSLEALSRTRK